MEDIRVSASLPSSGVRSAKLAELGQPMDRPDNAKAPRHVIVSIVIKPWTLAVWRRLETWIAANSRMAALAKMRSRKAECTPGDRKGARVYLANANADAALGPA